MAAKKRLLQMTRLEDAIVHHQLVELLGVVEVVAPGHMYPSATPQEVQMDLLHALE